VKLKIIQTRLEHKKRFLFIKRGKIYWLQPTKGKSRLEVTGCLRQSCLLVVFEVTGIIVVWIEGVDFRIERARIRGIQLKPRALIVRRAS